VRRNRNQIRQQTAPVGIVYPSSATVSFGNLRSGDVPNLLSAIEVQDKCNMVHALSAGDTVECIDKPVSPCASAVINVLGTYSAPKVDSIGDSSSDSGKEFGSVESDEESSKFQSNTDIAADGYIEESLAVTVQLLDRACNTAVSDSARTDVILGWQSIYALLLTRGTVRITERQYEDARVMLDWACKHGNLPSPSTMRRTIIPAIRDYSYARSFVCSLRTKNNEPTADSSLQAKNRASEGRVRRVFPSEWLLLDCRTGPVFESISGERTGIRALPGFKLLFLISRKLPLFEKEDKFLILRVRVLCILLPKESHTRRSDFLCQ
jgi:hypothetical protein